MINGKDAEADQLSDASGYGDVQYDKFVLLWL